MSCPICATTECWPIAVTADSNLMRWRAEAGVTQPYSWSLCKRCGNGYPSEAPLPEVLNLHWQADRRIEGDANAEHAVWQQRLAMSRTGAELSYRIFAPLFRGAPGRFLDIACGLGETVRKFRDCGWDAEGTELDASTKRFHEMAGLQTRIGRFEDTPLNQCYQMIQISHAIYFITEPMNFLRRVRAHLTDDGVFGVIISDFLAAYAQGGPIYAHSFYPCGDSMCYALALAGFDPFMKRTIGGDIFIAARPGEVRPPRINTESIHRRYRTKNLRFALLGRPYLAARRLAKTLLARR